MKPPRAPRTVEHATELLERVSRLDGEAATIAANRDAAIAATNAVADALLVPVIQERTAIAGVLEAWWAKDGKTLLSGKRKTVELGGCVIGTKAASTSLTFTADDFDAALKALQAARWAKPYVSVKYSVDKTATKKALEGKHGEQLRTLGFGTSGGTDVFVLTIVAQAGTVTA
ncbi:host-nuclease inhibitor Gam family protein [Sphingomonas echinoides]|uniref:Host-nuclease inhibitor Gam family protein n=1 Tax=Sphingomonas echinoides TaxID=59803 RepID=A0ABU4PMM4_9SPHN|nr:host-nuclease inhibitor Gam family protein [Sphingomonas echinoides]MDX5984684.1 host-nuclease inhibitor Gam family protein [Sphingomonas echinoides]